MPFYLVKRNPRNVDYDEYDKLVVRAKDEENAKQVAMDFAYGFNEDDVIVTKVKFVGEEQVILGSFCAG